MPELQNYVMLLDAVVVVAAIVCLSSNFDENNGQSKVSPHHSSTKWQAAPLVARVGASPRSNTRPWKER
jgi:hypothetical protein